jgi:hypothetical protein
MFSPLTYISYEINLFRRFVRVVSTHDVGYSKLSIFSKPSWTFICKLGKHVSKSVHTRSIFVTCPGSCVLSI